MDEFSGKSVLVFGGSREIGAAIVAAFTDAGAKVRFTYSGSKAAALELVSRTGSLATEVEFFSLVRCMRIVCRLQE